MKPLTIAARTVIGGLGLMLAVAGWRAGRGPAETERPPVPQPTVLAQAPLSTPQSTSSTAERTAPAASGQPGAPESSTTDDDDSKWGIGEPVDPQAYLAARDRAAAHSARSR